MEKKVKMTVANAIPEIVDNVDNVLIREKAGFLFGLVSMVENMMKEV